eukprot:3321403-Amphidinium_carterae.1
MSRLRTPVAPLRPSGEVEHPPPATLRRQVHRREPQPQFGLRLFQGRQANEYPLLSLRQKTAQLLLRRLRLKG